MELHLGRAKKAFEVKGSEARRRLMTEKWLTGQGRLLWRPSRQPTEKRCIRGPIEERDGEEKGCSDGLSTGIGYH